jgi:hypothetical protein
MTKTEYVIVCEGEELLTFAAANDSAAKQRTRRYLSRCRSASSRITATVCRVFGDADQWRDEIATVSARPRAI